jgi:hypothetical protein
MRLLTFQDILTQTLSLAGNKEQNMSFPPFVATSAVNLVTNYLLDSYVSIYPNSQTVVDKIRPFVKRKIVPINNGLVTLPDDYRNILSVGIAVDATHTSPCECSEEEIREADCIDCLPNGELIETCDDKSILYDAATAGIRKEKCRYIQCEQLDIDQFYKRTTSKLRPPTIDKPIYTMISKNQLKVCPIDINYVEIIYVKEPLKYNIAYTIMPDDTWQIDTASTAYVPLEWEINISPEFFRAFTTLYSIHTRDGSLVNWNNELKKIGIM